MTRAAGPASTSATPFPALRTQRDLVPSLLLFAMLVILALVVQIGEYSVPYFSWMLFVGVLSLRLVGRRVFLIGLLSVLILANDITPVDIPAVTLYDLSIYSFSIPSLSVLLFFAVGLLGFFGDRGTKGTWYLPRSLFLMMSILAYGLLIGIASGNSFREMINDSAIFLTPLALVLYLWQYHRDEWPLVFRIVTAALTAKFLVSPFNFLLGYGEVIGNTLMVVVDSTRNTTPVMLIWAIALLWLLPASRRNQLWALVVIGAALFVSINATSRTNIVLFLASLMIFLWTVRRSGVSLGLNRRLFRLLLWVFFGTLAAIPLTASMDLGFFFWKITSFLPAGGSQGHENMSSTVRYLEAINIVDHLDRNNRMLIGTGFGGFFEDKLVPFANFVYDTTTYPNHWIDAGTLYKPHTYPTLLLLKIGVVGLIAAGIVIWRVLFGWLRIKDYATFEEKVFMAAVTATMVVLFYKSFNLKLQCIQAFLLFVVLAAQAEIAARAGFARFSAGPSTQPRGTS